MEEQLYIGKTQNEKLELLKANCRTTHFMDVKIVFTDDDLTEMKSRLAENSIEKDNLETELSDMSKGLRDKIKGYSKANKKLLVNLKDGFEFQNQQVFEYDDQDNGLMLTYNVSGELIHSRKLHPSEKQTVIKLTKSA